MVRVCSAGRNKGAARCGLFRLRSREMRSRSRTRNLAAASWRVRFAILTQNRDGDRAVRTRGRAMPSQNPTLHSTRAALPNCFSTRKSRCSIRFHPDQATGLERTLRARGCQRPSQNPSGPSGSLTVASLSAVAIPACLLACVLAAPWRFGLVANHGCQPWAKEHGWNSQLLERCFLRPFRACPYGADFPGFGLRLHPGAEFLRRFAALIILRRFLCSANGQACTSAPTRCFRI